MSDLIITGIVLGGLVAWVILAALLGLGVGRFIRSGEGPDGGRK